ncbi:MAG: fumarylacetoacetate hydrolase family protein [Bacteroidales bacterium]|jgi:acylpyruvate hydrolase|nr:fumarylacetoacetate hydrolase family protein [Bacteroidales bacterium]
MKIICIGKNYLEHIREMEGKIPEEPIFFLKPDTALLRNNDPFYIPEWTGNLHHEVELVLRICRLGKNIEMKFAHRYYDAISLGIDFTARDVQSELMKKGLPWEKAKAFDYSAAISSKFFPLNSFPKLQKIRFRLDVNNQTVQQATSELMIFGFDEIISHISKFMTLKIGDLIYTGTPAGVGPVKIGDRLEGYLEDEKMFDFRIR